MALSKFANLLRNRYYLGLVNYRGVSTPASTPPSSSQDLFERVQHILEEREQHAIKQRRNRHYLRGLLTCARCKSRLLYTTGRGRRGHVRLLRLQQPPQRRRLRPAVPSAVDIEDRIQRAWHLWVHLDPPTGTPSASSCRSSWWRPGPPRTASPRPAAHRPPTPNASTRADGLRRRHPMDLLKTEQERITRERGKPSVKPPTPKNRPGCSGRVRTGARPHGARSRGLPARRTRRTPASHPRFPDADRGRPRRRRGHPGQPLARDPSGRSTPTATITTTGQPQNHAADSQNAGGFNTNPGPFWGPGFDYEPFGGAEGI